MNRRTYLAAAVSTGAFATTGCLGPLAGFREGDCEPANADRRLEGTWSMYAADAANTGVSETARGPAGDPTIRWCFPANFAVRASPAVAEGTVYVTSQASERDGPGFLHAVDAVTGRERWSVEHGANPSSAPAFVDGTVVVGRDFRAGLVAYEASDGSVAWETETDDAVDSNPTVVGGVAYVGSEAGSVYAVAAEDGAVQWRFEAGDAVDRTPAVVDRTVFVGSRDHHLYAIDAADGSERWRFEGDEMLLSAPAVVDGTAYIGSRAGTVSAIDVADGSERWRVSASEFIDDDGPAIAGASSQSAERPGVGRGSVDESGDEPGEGPRGTPGPQVNTSPAVVDGTVVFGSHAEHVHAHDAADGSPRWAVDTGRSIGASPAVADGTVYVGDHDGTVHAIDLADGSIRWSLETDRWISAGPALVDDLLFVGTDAARVYCLESD